MQVAVAPNLRRREIREEQRTVEVKKTSIATKTKTEIKLDESKKQSRDLPQQLSMSSGAELEMRCGDEKISST